MRLSLLSLQVFSAKFWVLAAAQANRWAAQNSSVMAKVSQLRGLFSKQQLTQDR